MIDCISKSIKQREIEIKLNKQGKRVFPPKKIVDGLIQNKLIISIC